MRNKNFTERELEVLEYLMLGKTNKEISEILMITHHTVKAHVESISIEDLTQSISSGSWSLNPVSWLH